MHRIQINIFLLLIFCVYNTYSQNQYSIVGLIKSKGEPVEFAVIALKNSSDSSLVKVTYSDTSGKFQMNGIKNGNYFILTSQIGHEETSTDIFKIQNKSLNIGLIEMPIKENLLNEIVIETARPMVEILPDRTVFNVKSTVNATGSNGFDLLRKAPGIIIDNNNNVILEGKTGVQIYIDGKASVLSGDDLTNFLSSLQSTDIESIEIITQPSSKYDAEGNAGIINIKLVKDKNLGTNGTVNVGYQYGRNHRGNSSISLNKRNKKLNLFANYSNYMGDKWHFVDFNRKQEGVQYLSETDQVTKRMSHNLRAGADWFINKNHTLGVLVSGNLNNQETGGVTTSEITPLSTNVLWRTLVANNLVKETNKQGSANLNYTYSDTSGKTFSMDVDYALYNRNINNYQPNAYLDGATNELLFENNYRMLTPTDISITSAKVDYEQRIGKGVLSLGTKYSIVTTVNSFQFYDEFNTIDILNTTRSNDFEYYESILAGYVNYAQKLNSKLSLQLGLRLEQTHSVGDLTSSQLNNNNHVERLYLNWFPSAGLTYQKTPTSTWSLTGSRRIQRPDYQSLNPFVEQINELGFRQGNPFLQPQYTTNIKLSNLYKYRLNTSISYSYVQDFFAQVTDTLGTDKSFLQPRNVADQHIINIGIGLPIQIKKWWNAYVSINAFNASFTPTDDKFKAVNRTTGNVYAQQSFLLKRKVKLEVSGWFNTPSIWGGTYLVKSMGALNLAIEKKFKNENWTARVSMNDLLFTSPWRANLFYGAVDIYGTGGGESRHIAFNLSYRFGNKNVKKQRNRATGLEEEKNRL